mmetsp:Transcript_8137/g.13331  ORF Transcript_8137/g.13331 Transcript_8137/m.13331 type:complete len:324 (-) Transcript_8137:88-1059(-)|eukprot:CAMPEP_0169272130 /NCGR_PEP_ID=MMETSP1016-20121227/50219_1 /TAXON_ID=342587 /ORGANISM="Karlodinium micrum, Strain CCMP2283" /LENGTH=323 /DNA_ID=CAMNT_0009357987 /DNA_START=1 /DNA_END=972 /DNA_ORIENTATION=+
MAGRRRVVKLALGTTAATTVGGGVAVTLYRQRLEQNKAVTAVDYNAAQNQEQVRSGLNWVQQEASHRSAGNSAALSGPGLELFRYTTCPYCGKVKAVLDFYGIPHQAVEVEPMFKKQISESKYKKLPQIRFGGEGGAYIVDSEIINDTLAGLLGIECQLRDADVQKWRVWVRDSLTRHITLNINKSLVEAWRGYSYIDAFDTIPFLNKLFLKVVGAPVMYLVAEYKTRPTLQKAGELQKGDDVREVFHRQVDQYVRDVQISDKKPFHGGARPDLADLEVYGVLQSVRGHEVYDDLLRSTSIAPWMARMDRATGKSAYELAPSA